MSFKPGDVVFYVPRHDQEYRHKPGLGVITDVLVPAIRIQDESSGNIEFVPPELVAHVDNISETLTLITFLNKKWLELQDALYRVELACRNSASTDSILLLVKQIKHYHIN